MLNVCRGVVDHVMASDTTTPTTIICRRPKCSVAHRRGKHSKQVEIKHPRPHASCFLPPKVKTVINLTVKKGERHGAPMKSDVEKTIDARVAAAFEDILPETGRRQEILHGAQNMVRAVWEGKIYAALPKDKTTIPEYFLDAELEQFLNEAIEECHARICSIVEQVKEEF
jgi:hypothetical protein